MFQAHDWWIGRNDTFLGSDRETMTWLVALNKILAPQSDLADRCISKRLLFVAIEYS